MSFDYIIVGAGIAGLYAAYRFLENDPSLKIAIFEQSNRVGGRLMQDSMGDTNVPLGAGIIRYPKDKHLLQLIKSLGLEVNVFPWIQTPSFKPSFNFDTVLQEMYRVGKDLHDVQFIDFVENFFRFDYKKVEEFLHLWGFTDMIRSPTSSVFKSYGVDDVLLYAKNRQMAVIRHGHWDALVNALMKRIQNKVTFKFNETVVDADIHFVVSTNRHVLETRTFEAKKMVVQTSGPNPVSFAWPFSRVFVRLRTPIELKARSLVTDTRLQRVIQMSPTVIMASYADGEKAIYWKDIETNTEKKKELLELLGDGEISMADIVEWKSKFWSAGTHFFDTASPVIPFNFIGEWVSLKNQGWVEGAIETVDEFFFFLERNFGQARFL